MIVEEDSLTLVISYLVHTEDQFLNSQTKVRTK